MVCVYIYQGRVGGDQVVCVYIYQGRVGGDQVGMCIQGRLGSSCTFGIL